MSEQQESLNYEYVINLLSKSYSQETERLHREKAIIHAQLLQERERRQAVEQQLAELQKKKK